MEENLFDKFFALFNQNNIGIIVNNSGAEYNEIYKNYFEKLRVGILADLIGSNTGFDDMTSQQISDFENLADYGTSEVAVFARNILIETGHLDYEEPVILPVEGLKSVEIQDDKKSDEYNGFRLYPNPAKDYFTVEYDAPINAVDVSIQISDMTGKKIEVQKLAPGRDKKMISTKNISTGVYLVSFIIDGNIISTEKLTIK